MQQTLEMCFSNEVRWDPLLQKNIFWRFWHTTLFFFLCFRSNRAQDIYLVIGSIAFNPHGGRLAAWNFFTSRFEDFKKSLGDAHILFGRTISLACKDFTSEEKANEVESFFQKVGNWFCFLDFKFFFFCFRILFLKLNAQLSKALKKLERMRSGFKTQEKTLRLTSTKQKIEKIEIFLKRTLQIKRKNKIIQKK